MMRRFSSDTHKPHKVNNYDSTYISHLLEKQFSQMHDAIKYTCLAQSDCSEWLEQFGKQIEHRIAAIPIFLKNPHASEWVLENVIRTPEKNIDFFRFACANPSDRIVHEILKPQYHAHVNPYILANPHQKAVRASARLLNFINEKWPSFTERSKEKVIQMLKLNTNPEIYQYVNDATHVFEALPLELKLRFLGHLPDIKVVFKM